MSEDQRPFTSAAFYQYLKEHRLMASRCKQCGALYLPPRPLCISCHGRDMEWAEMGGRGTLRTFTAIAVAPSFMVERGFGRTRPYCTGIVELQEGPCISGRIVGMDAQHPESIRVGMPMQVDFSEADTDPPGVAFHPT